MLIIRIVCENKSKWNRVRDLLSSSIDIDIPRSEGLNADLIVISNKRNIKIENV